MSATVLHPGDIIHVFMYIKDDRPETAKEVEKFWTDYYQVVGVSVGAFSWLTWSGSGAFPPPPMILTVVRKS